MNKTRYLKLVSTSLLLSQLLFTSTTVHADELQSEDAFPEALQGMISTKGSSPTNLQGASSQNSLNQAASQNHFLFGNVEQKARLPLPANVNETRLLSESAKAAPTVAPLHRLTAQQNNQNIGDTQNQTWFRIPPWLAGKWKIQDRQLIGEVNYRTGKQTPWRGLSFGYCGEQYGLQQDKNGTYWQFEKLGPNSELSLG